MKKRSMGAALSAALAAAIFVLGATGTHAAESESRRVTREYIGPGSLEWDYPFGHGSWQSPGMKLKTRAGEKHISVAVSDEVHDEVGGYIRQARSKNGPRVFHEFCGETDAPVRVAPRREVWIYVSTTPCGEALGLATRGEVTATFSGG
ncbi:MAG TPA: hypothetical protein VJ927_04800 [Actinomycetota bacterium]|nr:hypothetical protein [Actinomycetota bacterium]